MRGGRMRRVDEAMRAVLSDAIAKDLKDPRIGFVTVTGVKTSPDLRHARVYVSVLGNDPERWRASMTVTLLIVLSFMGALVYFASIDRSDVPSVPQGSESAVIPDAPTVAAPVK